MTLKEEPEFQIPDYEEQTKKVIALVASCKKKLESNKIEAIPYFNEILGRELDAVSDCLIRIDHFHASARCARATLELTMINLYRYFHSGGRLLDHSFKEKYGVKRLTSLKESPIRELISEGVIDDLEFGLFCESYGYLSGYVHSRVTYELCHTLPGEIKNVQWYAEVLKLSGEKGQTARIVKATLIKYSLIPALETLDMLLKGYKRIRSAR